MLKLETPKDVFQHLGEELGPSEWLTVTQDMIDKFAEATGDHQWIHVDVERAKREMPGGKTIAHGYLTLSLLPRLAPTLMKIEKRKRGLNYGSNKIRYITPVPAGARILTHCNAGALATAGYGTALGVVRAIERQRVGCPGRERHARRDEQEPGPASAGTTTTAARPPDPLRRTVVASRLAGARG